MANASTIVIGDLVADLRGECRCIERIYNVIKMLGLTSRGVEQIAHVIVSNSIELNEGDDLQALQKVFDTVIKVRCLVIKAAY